jgi:hypothetical protein
MDEAQHYRARAALALQVAAQISDGHAAADLKALAAEYEAKAATLDAAALVDRVLARQTAAR